MYLCSNNIKTYKAMVIKTYGIMELAQLYFPTITPKSAANKLSHWISINPDLRKAIPKYSKTLTPKQVKLIVEIVGEPEEVLDIK
jgi:hypothetical protein